MKIDDWEGGASGPRLTERQAEDVVPGTGGWVDVAEEVGGSSERFFFFLNVEPF